MASMFLVAESKLYLKDNLSLYNYFDDYSKLFNFLVRRTVHHLRHQLNGELGSKYRTRLMSEFNLTNRMAKAVIKVAKKQLKLLKELSYYQYKRLYKRKRSLQRKIEKLKLSLNSSRIKRRKLAKVRLFWTQMKLNKVNQLISNGLKLNLTFGTKHLLKTNKQKFLAKRDNQVIYIGSKCETCGNQQFQIYFNSKYNRFDYKLRLDNQWISGPNKYIFGSFVLKNKEAKVNILQILSTKMSNPLTYRIIKRDATLYLQISYRRETPNITQNTNGVLGVDFNKGFIALSEIDRNSNLIGTDILKYRFGKGSKTQSDLEKCISKILKRALETGKDICIENLNFKVKKFKTEKAKTKKGKQYNNMLHSLSYTLYDKLITNISFRNKVNVIKINPAWTSWIAKNKFCNRMKLNIHIGASFVIARKGIGIKDEVK